MGTIIAHSTKLQDRILWFDGTSTVPESTIINSVSAGVPISGLFVEHITKDIKQYNQYVDAKDKIKIKQSVNLNNIEWTIPSPHNLLDPFEYIIDLAEKYHIDYDDPGEQEGRIRRVVDELLLYKQLNLLDVLKVLIYIINTLQQNNVVWGVGRGSSVSSYILYLIGVHDVDSYAYDLDITDFLH